MRINRAIRPYSSKVTEKGDMTLFYCSDSKMTKDKKWTSTPPYMIGVKNLNFPIPERNPENYKIVPKVIEGVNTNSYNGKLNVTIWCSDIEIQDKEGNTIIESVKKAAKYAGKKLEDIQAEKVEAEQEPTEELEDLPF